MCSNLLLLWSLCKHYSCAPGTGGTSSPASPPFRAQTRWSPETPATASDGSMLEASGLRCLLPTWRRRTGVLAAAARPQAPVRAVCWPRLAPLVLFAAARARASRRLGALSPCHFWSDE